MAAPVGSLSYIRLCDPASPQNRERRRSHACRAPEGRLVIERERLQPVSGRLFLYLSLCRALRVRVPQRFARNNKALKTFPVKRDSYSLYAIGERPSTITDNARIIIVITKLAQSDGWVLIRLPSLTGTEIISSCS